MKVLESLGKRGKDTLGYHDMDINLYTTSLNKEKKDPFPGIFQRKKKIKKNGKETKAQRESQRAVQELHS